MAKGVIVVSGAFGFTGKYVSSLFENHGYEILRISSSRNQVDKNTRYCDLTDKGTIKAALKSQRIQGVVHLAAESFVAQQDHTRFYSVNTIGTTNLLEALDEQGCNPDKIIIASSANVYGNNSNVNLDEATPLNPANHYGASKVAMECLSKNWQSRFPIIITRPFNYTGPGQAPWFLIPKLVEHFKSRADKIKLGNLNVERDFSHVNDIAECYLRLFESDVQGETVNLCCARAVNLHQILTLLSEITHHEIDIEADPALTRKNEISHLSGSNKKLHKLTGFTPTQNIKQILKSMLDI